MGVEATVSFQKLYRKLKRIDYRHRRALMAATDELLRIIREEHMSGPTTPTSVSMRSERLVKSVRQRNIRTVKGRYYFGSIYFGTPYAGAHISKYYKDNPNLPYGTRVHWGTIAEQNRPKMLRAFRDAWGRAN